MSPSIIMSVLSNKLNYKFVNTFVADEPILPHLEERR